MMDDRMKESISALLDNEADELELRRVLSHSDDTRMKAVWSRYSKVSDLMSSGQASYSGQSAYSNDGEELPLDLHGSFLGIDISSQVSRAIEQTEGLDSDATQVEAAVTGPSPAINKNRFRVISMVAVAATIFMAVSLVLKPFNDIDVSDDVLVAYNDTVNVNQVIAETDIGVISPERQLLSDSVATAVATESVTMVEKPFSPEHASKLNQYLLRHAENSVAGGRSGLMPLARVASFTIAKN